MFHVSSDGTTVEFNSRLGQRRRYTTTQWDRIWPKLLAKMF